MRIFAIVLAAFVLTACAASLPPRFVLERDVGKWSYRRYQRVLDVEVAIADNEAVGHTATYVQRGARRRGRVPFANAFVSVYDEARALTAAVRRAVRALSSYETEVRNYGGGNVWYLDGGPSDRFALWVFGNHVVKIGTGSELRDVPEELVSAYMRIYPSDLDPHGHARPGTASEGELAPALEGDDEIPNFLRENAPR